MTKHKIQRTPDEIIWDDTEVYGGSFDDLEELLMEDVSLGYGKDARAKVWKKKTNSVGSMMRAFCSHRIAKKKGGASVLQGSLVQGAKGRTIINMESLEIMVLDMDSGQPISEVREHILANNLLAVIYTTHSHGSTTSTVTEKMFMKDMDVTRKDISAGGPQLDNLLKNYFKAKHGYHSSITKDMKYVKTEQVDGGIKIFVEHAPMEKYRIVLLLDEVYSFSDPKNGKDHGAAIANWKAKYAGVAQELKAAYDKSCIDPSRLFYLPSRRDKDAPYHTEIIIGDTLVLEEFKDGSLNTSGNAYLDAAGGDKKEGSKLLWLNNWLAGKTKKFLAGDFYQEYGGDELNVATNNSGGFTGNCPCDDRHSDAGNADDTGFFSYNCDPDADDNKQHGYMGCTHTGCQGFATSSFIEGMIDRGLLGDSKKEQLEALSTFIEDYEGNDIDDDDEDNEPAKEAAGKASKSSKTSDKSTSSRKSKPAKKAAKNDYSGAKTSASGSAKSSGDNGMLRGFCLEDYTTREQRVLKKIMRVHTSDAEAVDKIIDILAGSDFSDNITDVMLNNLAKKADFGKVGLKKQYAQTKKRLFSEEKKEEISKGGKVIMININDDASTVLQLCYKSLQQISEKNPQLFIMGDGVLCRIVENVETNNIGRQILSGDAAFSDLSRLLYFYKEGPKGNPLNVTISPDILKALRGATTLPLPILSSVVNHPIFSSDGRLQIKNGYDKNTTCYLKTTFDVLPVPDKPSADDLDAAYDLLFNELFVDFPFEDREPSDLYDDPGQSSKANLLAMLLQPFVRNVIGDNPTPMFVLDKSLPAAGATKIADIMSLIIDGVPSEKYMYNSNEEEMGKILLAKLVDSPDGMMYYDNINRKVDSTLLATALTSSSYSGRYLGSTTKLTIPTKHVWMMSGNNIQFSNEISRRCVPITILPKEAKPMYRTGFKHPFLEQWVRENRAELVQALCVIVQNWVNDGMPKWKPVKGEGQRLATFEDWSNVIGGILQSFGMDGFLNNLSSLHNDSSDEETNYTAFITACIEVAEGVNRPFFVKDLHSMEWDDNLRGYETLGDLPIRVRDGEASARSNLGVFLRTLKDRPIKVVINDEEMKVRIVKDGVAHSTIRWMVKNVDD